jgi:prolipoprotein diacylglyceryltransferase
MGIWGGLIVAVIVIVVFILIARWAVGRNKKSE